MTTQFNLKTIVDEIAQKVGDTPELDEKFELVYLIDNVTEEDLLDMGFQYTGMSRGNVYPTYQLGNIFAAFNGPVLQVMESSSF